VRIIPEADMRRSALIAFVIVAVAFGNDGSAAEISERMHPGRIQIEYGAPQNPDHRALYLQLRERGSLERVQAIFMPFRLPADVTIRTIGCDGVSNAWYLPVDGRPTITVCYEYLYELWNRLPTMVRDDGTTPTDALVGQMLFAFAHEFGHLAFDVY